MNSPLLLHHLQITMWTNCGKIYIYIYIYMNIVDLVVILILLKENVWKKYMP